MLHLVLYPAVESVSKDSSSVVIRQLSGELICALEPEQSEQSASSHGDSVRVSKQHSAELRGESRYKVKSVTQGRVLQDQDLLSELRPPLDSQMSRLDYVAPTPTERESLFTAAKNGDTAMLDEILSKPVDPNVFTDWRERLGWNDFAFGTTNPSCSQSASAGGHRDCVRMSIDAKASVAANCGDPGGEPALFEASRSGHWEIVSSSIEAKADVDETAMSGKTPIQAACEGGHTEAVQVLLKANAKKPESVSGCSNRQIVRLLSNAGVERSEETMSAAMWHAVGGGKAEVSQVLLEAGANPNVSNKEGKSPLWYAADLGRSGYIAQLLLEAGADKNWVDEQGTSPLWTAADHGNLEIVKILVKAGADCDKVNKRGVSPLQIAKYRGHPDVVESLLSPERDRDSRRRRT